MNLYFIGALWETETDIDQFVFACSVGDAVEYWKHQHPLSWEHGNELVVYTVPTDNGILGCVPMETVTSQEVVL